MDSDTIWRHIDEQRIGLADLLDGVAPQQWSVPSLCSGWTVRDVAAHITQSQWAPQRFVIPALRSGFRFNVMMRDLARSDRRTPEQLVTALRQMPGCRRRPPGTTELDPLTDMLVHGQDIAVPLGLEYPMPIPAAVAVAERLWRMRFPLNPSRRLPGKRFIASDADFAVGEGTRVEAPIRDIVLAFADRPAAIPGLSAGQAPA
ncbi:maleylpyruvate isomerase family mycothiol-dependent enzyme [soil metagenome]